MKVKGVKKSDQIDKLRRRLLRLGAYVAPAITIISLSHSRAQAQACTPEPCDPDLGAPPIFRKKKFDEGEEGERLDSLWEDSYSSEDPFEYSSEEPFESRKSPWNLRTPFKNSIKNPMKDRFRRSPFKKLPGLEPEEKEE